MTFFRILSSLVSLALVSASIGPVTDLTLTTKTVQPDGSGVNRDAIVFEQSNTVIGPLIKGFKGDTFKINVINKLNNANIRKPTSIHWHGILQDGGHAWADGPAFVTQCPIAGQGHSFQYEFKEPNQAGTFWYHSHLSTQYCDGARGPLVIYDRNDPYKAFYDVDDDTTVITLADWYHQYAGDILIGVSDSTLINGLGRYAGTGGTASTLPVITVTKGKRYRFRFINIACDPYFTVSIDKHTTMTVIEADSENTVPVIVDSFDILAGQRYSVIVKADQPIGNYWLRASVKGASTFAGGTDSAILRYVGAPIAEPTTTVGPLKNKLREQKLIPLNSPGAPGVHKRGAADVVVRLDMELIDGPRFAINGASFVPPSVPVLLQILSGAQTAQSLLPTGSYIPVKQGQIVEITFNVSHVEPFGSPHPFHLHGHSFDVIRSVGETKDNWLAPPRRDVVSTGLANDNVTIRFRADNAGPWFLHCHIDWHLEAGLAVILAESSDSWKGTVKPTDQWNQLCPIYNGLADGDK